MRTICGTDNDKVCLPVFSLLISNCVLNSQQYCLSESLSVNSISSISGKCGILYKIPASIFK